MGPAHLSLRPARPAGLRPSATPGPARLRNRRLHLEAPPSRSRLRPGRDRTGGPRAGGGPAPMRVALVAFGTRGDVQPFVCLGRALADRGHEVEVVVPRNGEAMVLAAGLRPRLMPMDWTEILRAEPAQRMLAAGKVTAYLRWQNEEEKVYAAELRRVLLEATESVDLIVSAAWLDARCRAIAKARGIAMVSMHLYPHVPSRTY